MNARTNTSHAEGRKAAKQGHIIALRVWRSLGRLNQFNERSPHRLARKNSRSILLHSSCSTPDSHTTR